MFTVFLQQFVVLKKVAEDKEEVAIKNCRHFLSELAHHAIVLH